MEEGEKIKPENAHENSEIVNENISQQQPVAKNELQTTNCSQSPADKSQTEEMEVHHHPDLHHKKKNFREYLFEFLMIFLAVTAGFFAENIREHISDNKKEEQYIRSLLQNLDDDTARLGEVIEVNSVKVKGFDSLLHVSKNRLSDLDVQDSLFYYTLKYLPSNEHFENNDNTLTQLRNAGGYRLIQKDHVADSIAAYEANVNGVKNHFRYYDETYLKVIDQVYEVLDITVLHSFMGKYTETGKIPANFKVLLVNDDKKLASFYNKFFALQNLLKQYIDLLQKQLDHSRQTIIFLKKEYNLE